MPSVNRMSTPVALDEDVIEARYASIGEYTVGFETHKQDIDAPLFAGLPGDRCPCTHWGVVTAGRMVLRWQDHEDLCRRGRLLRPSRSPAAAHSGDVADRVQSHERARGDHGCPRAQHDGCGGLTMSMHTVVTADHLDSGAEHAVQSLVCFLESGAAPEGLFAPTRSQT